MSPPCKMPRIDGEENHGRVYSTENQQAENRSESFDYGFIRFAVEGISQLDEVGKLSQPVYVQGMPWWILACKEHRKGEPCLAVYLSCMPNQSQMWSVDVGHEHTLVHPDSSKSVVEDMGVSSFTYEFEEWGSTVLAWTSMMEQGFVVGDGILVEARIWIKKTIGFRTDVDFDFDIPNEPYNGLVLDLGDRKFYVSKELLSIHSPVFKNMFYGPFDEKNKQEIPLKDVDPKEFNELLRVLYPSRYTVTDDNIDVILKLADQFQIKGHCLEELDSQKKIVQLKKNSEFKNLSDKMKNVLLDKMIELAAKIF